MKKWIKSIKQHTLLLLVSLTLGLALVFSSLAVVTAFVVEDMLLDNFLEQEAKRIEVYYKKHNQFPPVTHNFITLFTDKDSLPDWVRKNVYHHKLSGEIFTPDATHYHYRKLYLGNHQGYLLAEVSQLLVVTQQPGIFSVFFLVLLILIAIAVWLTFRFARRIVDPVLSLTHAVIANTTDNKVRLPKLSYELGYLADTLQASFDRLNQLLENEKAFATNVSHELRTPLTVLKNAVQLIEQRGYKHDDLVSIKNAGEQMEQMVNVLLALARSESRVTQTCYLKSAIEEAILRCHLLVEKFQLQLEVSTASTVEANPVLLELLLINLIRNAVEHSCDACLKISENNSQLIFENKTYGCIDADLTRAGVKGESSNGVGQGLYLVRRIAEHFGWKFTVETAQKYFRVCINFQ